MPALIIHGGAWRPNESFRDEIIRVLNDILQSSYQMLIDGCSAVDVVESSIAQLEDYPLFEAGTGSIPNSEGLVEMDTIIVDGTSLKFGALASIRNVKNPIKVARFLMENSKHHMLVGNGAQKYAFENGFDFVENESLVRTHYKSDSEMGTVGAVALDVKLNISAGTSTGGISGKPPGRVGDSCIIGSGAIAESRIGGVSVTGEGEAIMRVMLSRRVLDSISRGESPMKAAQTAVEDLKRRVDGQGGVICLNQDGLVGYYFNSEGLVFGFIDSEGNRRLNV